MADPDDEFERILSGARAQLDGIRLELPTLEDGSPPPPSPQSWAAASLAPGEGLPPVAREPSVNGEEAERLLAGEARLPVSDRTEEPQIVRNVEVRPSQTAPSAAAQQRHPGHLARLVAAALLATGSGLWWSLRPTQTQTVLPLASFDAIAARDAGEWLVARGQDLILYDASLKSRTLARLDTPLTAMIWAEGALYGTDGKNTLFRWERLDAPPKMFSLDHAPLAIYVRPPHIWSLDERGSLRQFLLARSMTGVFLQPLDRVEVRLKGDFSLADDGTLLLLERSSGRLLGLTREKSAYGVTARGASYGPEARLLASGVGLWIAQVDAEKTSLVLVPPLPR